MIRMQQIAGWNTISTRQLKGGYQIVSKLADLTAIKQENTQEGMIVHCIENDADYILTRNEDGDLVFAAASEKRDIRDEEILAMFSDERTIGEGEDENGTKEHIRLIDVSIVKEQAREVAASLDEARQHTAAASQASTSSMESAQRSSLSAQEAAVSAENARQYAESASQDKAAAQESIRKAEDTLDEAVKSVKSLADAQNRTIDAVETRMDTLEHDIREGRIGGSAGLSEEQKNQLAAVTQAKEDAEAAAAAASTYASAAGVSAEATTRNINEAYAFRQQVTETAAQIDEAQKALETSAAACDKAEKLLQAAQELKAQIDELKKQVDAGTAPQASAPAAAPKRITLTIHAEDWKDRKYVVANEDIKAGSFILTGLPIGPSAETCKAFSAAGIANAAQADGSLTLEALNEVPEKDITVEIVVFPS